MSHASRTIDIVYFDAGSGHRSSALALQRALVAARPTWGVRMVDAESQLFAVHPRFHSIVRRGIAHFNGMLRRERVFDLKGLINLSLLFHDLLTPRDMGQIAAFWAAIPPDTVVSVTPMYNPAIFRSASIANPHVRYVTIPVDFEEVKPRYWFTPAVPQHYLLGSERLLEQGRRAGLPAELLHRLPGFPIDPGLYDPAPVDRVDGLVRLGLDPALPTALLSFGGQGSVILLDLVRRLAAARLPINMLVLCGRSEGVRARLASLRTPYPIAALGYQPQTPLDKLQLADCFIGKPGTMTITEALVLGRPLVAIKSTGMRPVQAGNERWLEEQGAGVVARPQEVAEAVGRVLADRGFAERARRAYHRAVFAAAEQIVSLTEGAPARQGAPSMRSETPCAPLPSPMEESSVL